FTFTNIGAFGNIMGVPIINQPQAAILAVGTIKKKPAVLETEQGDVIAIRHMMYLSMSYDHRIIDGALGGTFLKRVADYLDNSDTNREISIIQRAVWKPRPFHYLILLIASCSRNLSILFLSLYSSVFSWKDSRISRIASALSAV